VLRFVNERWQEITGFDLDAALGKNWQQIIHPDDRALMAEQWAKTGALGSMQSVYFRDPDGNLVEVSNYDA